jgi:formylglycine-generating enzyme required for sulfatase activity
MNYLQAATFTMGTPSSELGRAVDETLHSVTLTRSIFLDQSEVTQGQWKALSGGLNPSFFQSTSGTRPSVANENDDGPVEQVDWYSALAFANARSADEGLPSCYALEGCVDAMTGWMDGVHTGCVSATFGGLTCTGYRLPTESEWEFAARSGSTSATYLGNLGAAVTDCTTAQANLDGIAWWCFNSGSRTAVTRAKSPNSSGLYDMLGNVWEWTGDWYGPYPGTVTDPVGPAAGASRVLRGGAWNFTPQFLRAGFRYSRSPNDRDDRIGFRLVRTAP